MRKSLDVQIDHGMHCKAFSPARFVDTGERKKKHRFISALRSLCALVCASASVCVCRLPIEARRHMAVQLHGPDSTI